MMQRPMVPKRVYSVIFFWPSAPLFCSASSAGTTGISRDRMIDEVM